MKKPSLLLLAAFLIGCGGGGGDGNIGGGGPTVSTLAALSSDGTTANVEGSINPNGLNTNAWFEWGTDPSLSTYSTTPAVGVGSGNGVQRVTASVSGLSEGKMYYFRVAARNSSGTTRGAIESVLAHVRGEFGNPSLIETLGGDIPAGSIPVTYRVAISTRGDAIVVWLQSDGLRYSVWANRFTAAEQAWSGAALLEGNDIGDASYPRIGMDNAGNAIVVWKQDFETAGRILANRYSAADNAWSGEKFLDPPGVGFLFDPELAVSAGGDAIVVWTRHPGVGFGVWTARYSAVPGSWSSPARLLEDIPGEGGAARVAASAGGDAIAIWEQDDGMKSTIWGKNYSAVDGIWSGAYPIMQFDPIGSNRTSRIAMSAGGDAVVACTEFDTGRVWGNRYSSTDNAWSGAVLLETSNPGTAWDPELAMSDGGDAIVVWRRAVWITEDFNNVIRANRFSAAERTWSGAFSLEPSGTETSVGANIAMAPNGDAIVGWGHYAGTRSGGIVNRYSAADNSWSGAFPVERDASRFSSSPAVGISAGGDAIAVFPILEGERWDLWATWTY